MQLTSSTALAVALLTLGAPAAAQTFTYEKIWRTGEPANLVGIPGATATNIQSTPAQIDNAGNVLFWGHWSGPSGMQQGLLYGGPQGLTPVQVLGQDAPGFEQFGLQLGGWSYVLAENGTIVTRTNLGMVGNPTSAGSAIYAGTVGDVQLVAGTGLPAAAGVPGVVGNVSNVESFLRANGNGQVAFGQSVFDPPGTPSVWTIVSGPPQALQVTAAFPGPVPGISGASFVGTTSLSYNDLGWTGFSAFMEGPGIDPANHYAMFVGGPADLQIVAREGDPAPGVEPGVNFINFSSRPTQNADGDVGFFGVLNGPGIDNSNGFGLWAGPRDDLQLVARVGSQAHSLPEGTSYTEFVDHGLADGHNFFYRARFAGPGVNDENDDGYWWGDYTDPELLLREGDTIAGFPEGSTIQFSTFPYLRPLLVPNDSGDLLLFGAAEGPLVTDADRYAVWFRTSSESDWQLVLRTGQEFDGKLIESGSQSITALDPFGTDGSGQSINDQGIFALSVDFTDGTTGLYRFTVPEPSLALVAVAALVTCARCRKREEGESS